MCGRYTIRTPVQRIVDAISPVPLPVPARFADTPRFNVAPSQAVAAIRLSSEGELQLALLEWGLLPAWAKAVGDARRPINARADGVAEKPTFRGPFRKRRCLLLADGFYEWRVDGRVKHPTFIRRADDAPFAFAGLWDAWGRGGETVESCALITTTPSATMRPIHDRMPVMLDRVSAARWMDPMAGQDELLGLLTPFGGTLNTIEVSTRVNSPRNDDASVIEPAA